MPLPSQREGVAKQGVRDLAGAGRKPSSSHLEGSAGRGSCVRLETASFSRNT